jgi:hypothetical protein
MTAPTRSTSDGDLVKVAYAQDQTEAEFLQHDADVGSVARRAPGFDVPEFLARRSASRARRPRPSSPHRTRHPAPG